MLCYNIYHFIWLDVISKKIKIIEDIKKEYENGKDILVLTERLEHLDYIHDKLSKYINNIFKYYGGIGKKVFNKYKELNDEINLNNSNKIIISTGSYIGDGFDDDKLDVLFLTMPISGKTRVIQYVGRLHRKNEN